LLRRAAGDGLPQILRDEGEAQIDARGNAGGGPDRTISGENSVRFQTDVWVTLAARNDNRPDAQSRALSDAN
jgi:hypothetical protein